MISWDSSSVLTASARLATLVKPEWGCESQEQSGREQEVLWREGILYPRSTATVSCSFSVLQCPLRMAPAAPAMGSEQHRVNGMRKTLAVIHCPWREGYD